MDLNLEPLSSTTEVEEDVHIWRPNSFENLLIELQHIIEASEGPRFRGQSRAEYLLDSSLARSIQIALLGKLSIHTDTSDKDRFDELRGSLDMMWLTQGILQTKFGGLIGIPQELTSLIGANPGIDPYFELMRHIQQYLESDAFIPGSPLLDWSHDPHVGLYFAAINGDGSTSGDREGALWICDARAMGKIEHQDPDATLSVEQALDQIRDKVQEFKLGGEPLRALPLIFDPKSKLPDLRAERQKVVYFLQVDLRYDLSALWRRHEDRIQRRLFLKLILPIGSQPECVAWLVKQGVSKEYLFPHIQSL